MKKLLILRPEPGASASAEHARVLGLDALVCPLFAIEPVAWAPPDPARFDALLITSANALRHGGPGLDPLSNLPVAAVGEASAAAARDAGFTVSIVGSEGVEALLDSISAPQRLLHLCGEDRTRVRSRHSIAALPVYRAALLACPALPDLANMVVAVHSPRAGARLDEVVKDRSKIAIAAISESAAAACDTGWQAVEWAAKPTNSALLALAARLCQSPRR